MNKKTLVVLFLLALIVLTACEIVRFDQDKNGTPPPTRIPKLKIEVHGAEYLCNRYAVQGGDLYLYGCQGLGSTRVVIRNAKDFQVTPYKPVPTPRG